MKAALWLAARELSVASGRAAVAVAVVAAAAALVSATEVLSRSREEAIARDLDAIGPSIVVLPSSAPAGAPASYDPGRGMLPRGAADEVRRALGGDLRRIEARLAIPREGERPLVVGVEAEHLAGVPAGGAAAGSVLAERLGPGETVEVGDRRFRVAGALPTNASAEDLALFVRLDELQAALGASGVNELRIHLAPGADPRAVAERLAAASIPGRVSRIDRGEVADGGALGALARHRIALYAFTGLVSALALLIAAHLDAAERRLELATLVAIGAAPATVMWAVMARSTLVAAAGALAGIVAGSGLAAIQDLDVGGLLRATPSLLSIAAATVALGVVAAMPSALASAHRNPVADLQEAIS